MLNIGFLEIVTVCVVALLVLGPDKLPGTVRTVGLWVGRLKRSFNNIKSEIEKEVGADEIRRQLRNEEIMEKIKKTQKQFTSTVDSVKKEAAAVTSSLKPEGLDELRKDFDSATGKKPDTTPGPESTVKDSVSTAEPAPARTPAPETVRQDEKTTPSDKAGTPDQPDDKG